MLPPGFLRAIPGRRLCRLLALVVLPAFLAACNDSGHPVLLQSSPSVGLLKEPPPNPSAPQQIVQTEAGPGGAFNPVRTTVTEGQRALLTVIAEPGFALAEIEGCGGELKGGYRFHTAPVTASCTVTARFVPLEHQVTTMVRSDRGGTVTEGGRFAHGAAATVRAMPAPGFAFTGWTEAATLVSTDAEYTFTVESDRSLSAAFAEARNVTQVPLRELGAVALFEANHAPAGMVFAGTRERSGDGQEGLWRSDDGGETWERVIDGLPRFVRIGAQNPDWVLAGFDDRYRLSTDGGRTWSEGTIGAAGGQVVRPVGAAVAGPEGGLFVASSALSAPGIYHSGDGGESWRQVLAASGGATADVQIRALDLVATTPPVVLGVTAASRNIWRSVDGGESFASIRAQLPGDRPRMFDAGVRADPGSAERILVESLVSVNGGANWSPVVTPALRIEQTDPGGSEAFEVDPGEEPVSPRNTVWLGGALVHVARDRLLASDDFGQTWDTLLVLRGATGNFEPTRVHLAEDALYLQLVGGPDLVHRVSRDAIEAALEAR